LNNALDSGQTHCVLVQTDDRELILLVNSLNLKNKVIVPRHCSYVAMACQKALEPRNVSERYMPRIGSICSHLVINSEN
jgi:hypothetical protein